MKANLIWKGKMQFEAHNREFVTTMDATAEHGGDNKGPSPKEYVLNAMMGCTAMDVVSMLQKMRQPLESLNLEIESEKNQDHPIHFKKIRITFLLTGGVQPDKVVKAVTASLTKYCGVNYMISKVAEITYQVKLNGQMIHEGKAEFVDPIK